MKASVLTWLAIMLAIAIVLNIAENWLPLPFLLPGIKLGLANIVSLWMIAGGNYRFAIIIAVMRVFIAGLLTGAFMGPSFIMAFAGAVVSNIAMIIIHHANFGLSLIGLSITGATAHIITQLLVVCLLLADWSLFNLWPYYMLLAILSGVSCGCIAQWFWYKRPSFFDVWERN